MQERLSDFERQFDYPLGEEGRFFISHGEDYTRFFRAMGDATCLVAKDGADIVGTLAVTARHLATPAGRTMDAAYLADLKIALKARGGFVLKQLARTASAISHVSAGYSVVMRGTRSVPDTYTDRIGIPAFRHLGSVDVLRIPVDTEATNEPCLFEEKPLSELDEVFLRHSRGSHVALGDWGRRSERSSFAPMGLVSPDGNACGVVEDTLRSKCLFLAGGEELRSSHLSNFAFGHPESGGEVIRAALAVSYGRRLPALFTAVPAHQTRALLESLRITGITCAPADIYGIGLDAGLPWNINTAEI